MNVISDQHKRKNGISRSENKQIRGLEKIMWKIKWGLEPHIMQFQSVEAQND